ncbi:hypothetical protein TARUN_8824 [Trichoderma arundinaceum]|uniref:Uncharacterized protein n=1 Tax=Trichoderma arundinaceum TaxID=490622 RepID=A0A395NBE5_TRIAR|nr:hypothetical protein TARUN_8824 [Trichoderma arundinaceum]
MYPNNLKKARNIKDEHHPTDLFFEISHAASRRQQEGIRWRGRQPDAEREREEEEDYLLRAQQVHEDEEKAKAEIEKLITETFKKDLDTWREKRNKEAQRDRLSRAEVDDEVLRMVEKVHRAVGLGKRRMEDGTEEPHDEWRGRMVSLRRQIYRVWNENQGRICMGLPRYVEGYPVREGIKPPKFLPGRRQKLSGLGACLQCEVKGLGCSRSMLSGRVSGRDLQSKGCKRCEEEGERCIVEWELEDTEEEELQDKGKKESGQKDYTWDWVDGSSGPEPGSETESVAEAVEMWERRRRGAKLELVGGSMQWVEAGGFAPRKSEKA